MHNYSDASPGSSTKVKTALCARGDDSRHFILKNQTELEGEQPKRNEYHKYILGTMVRFFLNIILQRIGGI